MNSLQQALARWRPDRIVLASSDRMESASDLLAGLESLRHGAGSVCRGRIVALQLSAPAALLRELCWLDGFASGLLLLPPDISPELRAGFLRTAGADFLLDDSLAPQRVSPLGPPVPSAEIAGPTRWILPTSGTTREPKLVGHDFHSLTRSCATNHEKGARFVWGLLYSPTRFAGLQVVLQAVCGGSTLVVPPIDVPLSDRVGFFLRSGVTALSATPTLWRKLLMTPNFRNIPLQQITLGGEIADQAVLNALRQAFPVARIVHIYASTEAGVGFAVDDGQAGFPTTFLQALPGRAQLRVEEGDVLWIRPTGATGAYVGAEKSPLSSDGFVCTGDKVELREDRYYFLGRESGSINVGGNKVMPEEVEAVLHLHPAVALATIQPLRSSIMGQLVKASVQPVAPPADPAAFKNELREHCARHLAAYKVPAVIELVGEVRLSSAGKTLRHSNHS